LWDFLIYLLIILYIIVVVLNWKRICKSNEVTVDTVLDHGRVTIGGSGGISPITDVRRTHTRRQLVPSIVDAQRE
jgi:DNA-binding transcriptional regulator of glucitol operon